MASATLVDWSGVDTVLLDMDGTLLDLHFDNHFWIEHVPLRYAEARGMSLAEANDFLGQRFAREQGTLNWYCVDFWSAELGLDIAALKEEVADRIGFRPSVHAFLQRVRASGRTLALVTNAHHKSLAIKLRITGLRTAFDQVICSHDYRQPKEMAAFWQRLHNDVPYAPARTLLIDDSLAVLRAARAYGIAHCLTIARPDLHQPVRTLDDEFSVVHDFVDILPPEVIDGA